MENLEIVNLSVDLTDLAHRAQRQTNYADAGSANPSAQQVLNATADADLYANLLADAKGRALRLLGRHCKSVLQPDSDSQHWLLALQLPARNYTALFVSQLTEALTLYLATDIAAHWLTLVNSDRAVHLMQLSLQAQEHLQNLSLWQVRPPHRRLNPML